MKPALSVMLLFLAAAALLGGAYALVAAFLFWKPQPVSGVLQTVIMLAMGVGLVFVAARFWDRWATAFLVIMLVVGVGGLQTSTQSNDPKQDALTARTFQISGGLLAVAGGVVYLLAGRRRS